MRKSNKKVKSERINALRKQYDAFLEEDKQRKSRNCLILERLNKLCINSVLVQLRNRRNMLHSDRYQTVNHPIQKEITNYVDYSTQLTRHVTADAPKEIFEESLIQEISKKYILIPKSKSTPLYEYTSSIESNTNDNADWKHKYEILNQLKKTELDSQIKGCGTDNYYKEVSKKDEFKQVNDILNRQGKIQDLIENYGSNEKPIKETTGEKFTKDLHIFKNNETLGIVTKDPISTFYNQAELTKHKVDKKTEMPNSKTYVSDDNILTNVILNVEPDNDSSKDAIQNEILVISKNMNDYTEMDSENIKPNKPIVTTEQNICEQRLFPTSVQENTLQNNDIQTNNFVNEQNNTNEDDYAQYPNEVTYAQELTPNSQTNIQLKDDHNISPDIQHKMIDSSYQNDPGYIDNQGIVDIIPQYETQVENTENVDITSGIEAFDAEQSEMFYSEQTQENYEFDQSNIVGNTYNNQEIGNNENYQQNTEYCEDAELEGYPVEINDHEETSQPYDQNYKEQYLNYEQPQHHEQLQQYEKNQHYEQTQQYEQNQYHEQPQVDDIIQPEIDQLQYEQQTYETQNYVESQLDHEQGLIEKQMVNDILVDNLQNQEEQVAD